MNIFFLSFVAAVAVIVVIVIAKYFGNRIARLFAIALSIWFAYVGLLSYFGVIAKTNMRPPGIVFVLFPVVVALIVGIVRMTSHSGERISLAIPLWIILCLQVFRVGVELFLHELWIAGIIPKMLTFAGANVDIYIGATAPFIAWLSTRGRGGLQVALAWNVLGLLALANVVARAVLTTPGPLNFIHAERPNLMFGTFPFAFIPAFFVPLAVMLHAFGLRSIFSQWKTARKM